MAFTANPHRPSDQRAEGSVSPRSRLSRTHPIEVMYVDMRATVARLIIASKATLLPRLIRDMAQTKTRVSRMALTGTSKRSSTVASHDELGRPWSRLRKLSDRLAVIECHAAVLTRKQISDVRWLRAN